jgi:hypothetical protein
MTDDTALWDAWAAQVTALARRASADQEMIPMTMQRAGDWMQLASGRQFWPLDPRPDEVHIEDIAHALSMMCRYGGHTTRFYSVAEHCVHISRACSPENALAGLLHDASEAYATDIIRPIKPFLPGYRQIEDRLSDCIAAAFGLPEAMPAEVKALDIAILRNEYEQIMATCPAEDWGLRYSGIPGLALQGWPPSRAKARFLARFRELTSNE